MSRVDNGRFAWKVRRATEGDLPSALWDLTSYMDAQQRAKYNRKLKRYTRDANKELLLALDGARAIGFLCVTEYDEVPATLPADLVKTLEDYACTTSFIVHPDYRRRGVGASLFARALEWGFDRRPNGMWLITHRTGPWYQRHFALKEVGKIDVDGVRKTVMALAGDSR